MTYPNVVSRTFKPGGPNPWRTYAVLIGDFGEALKRSIGVKHEAQQYKPQQEFVRMQPTCEMLPYACQQSYYVHPGYCGEYYPWYRESVAEGGLSEHNRGIPDK